MGAWRCQSEVVDSAASRAYVSATGCFLGVAEVAVAHLDEVGLGVWSARDLLGHTGRSLITVVDYLDAAQDQDLGVDLSGAADYYRVIGGALADVEAVAERGRVAGAALGDDPMAVLGELAGRALDRVGGARVDALVATPFGTLTLEDYLPTRVVELAVHACDLGVALGVQVDVPREVAEVAFAVLGELAATRPDVSAVLLALTGRRPLPEGYSLM